VPDLCSTIVLEAKLGITEARPNSAVAERDAAAREIAGRPRFSKRSATTCRSQLPGPTEEEVADLITAFLDLIE
jgi:hypothetical protein